MKATTLEEVIKAKALFKQQFAKQSTWNALGTGWDERGNYCLVIYFREESILNNCAVPEQFEGVTIRKRLFQPSRNLCNKP
ncbi:MAG: hypothetical protein HY986_13490 [Candidatus Melainabacteria bacterium]|nr:hypothetical protein [Candidatus Melainabacteria bacterium]